MEFLTDEENCALATGMDIATTALIDGGCRLAALYRARF